IERIAKKLEQYEPVAENNENYRVDIWCGYVDSPMLKAMLDSARSGVYIRPPTVRDPSEKIRIVTNKGTVELHSCSAVLVIDQDSSKVMVGRGIPDAFEQDVSMMYPAIGITIFNTDRDIYDIDYIR
ncbi:MAG: hypothetical protein ACP5KJ_02255, partial [Candidatus Micrarchaeia archaeon]